MPEREAIRLRFLAEPRQVKLDWRFTLFGAPVRVHPSFWLAAFLIHPRAILWENAVWIAVVLVSLLAHEFGHWVVVRRTRGQARFVLHGFGELAVMEPGGSVSNHWKEQVRLHLAGPAANLALAGAAALAAHLSGVPLQADKAFLNVPLLSAGPASYGAVVLGNLLFFNLIWAAVNLLPVFPLDGGRMMRAVLTGFPKAPDAHRHMLVSLGVVAVGAAAAINAMDLTALLFCCAVVSDNLNDLDAATEPVSR
jgi:stage IV sporulation protein FB